jgi:hypothetical protein
VNTATKCASNVSVLPPEQGEREAVKARAFEMMGPPRMFRMEGEVLREVTDEDF